MELNKERLKARFTMHTEHASTMEIYGACRAYMNDFIIDRSNI